MQPPSPKLGRVLPVGYRTCPPILRHILKGYIICQNSVSLRLLQPKIQGVDVASAPRTEFENAIKASAAT